MLRPEMFSNLVGALLKNNAATRNFAVGAPIKETHNSSQSAECNALLRVTTGECLSSPERLPGKFTKHKQLLTY